MAVLANLVGFTTTTTGTGTITVGSALQGLRTLAGASIADGTVVSYGIKTGATGSEQYETGTGTVGGTGTTLTRSLSASSTGSLLNLSGTSEVYITDLAADHSTGTPASTDVVQTFTAAQRGSVTTLTDAATIASNFALGNFFTVTLAGNRTLGNPTNLVAGQSGSIFIVQDATGSRTLSYDTAWDFPGGTVPTLTTTANAVDRLDYLVRNGSSIHANLVKDVK